MQLFRVRRRREFNFNKYEIMEIMSDDLQKPFIGGDVRRDVTDVCFFV